MEKDVIHHPSCTFFPLGLEKRLKTIPVLMGSINIDMLPLYGWNEDHDFIINLN